jgi:hypothetical protein
MHRPLELVPKSQQTTIEQHVYGILDDGVVVVVVGTLFLCSQCNKKNKA